MTLHQPESRGGGTVYRKGGADVRKPKSGLFGRVHPGMTAAVAAGLVGSFALGWFIWFGSREPQKLVDLAQPREEAAAAPAAGSTPSPVESSPEPVALAVGARSLEALDTPGSSVSRLDGLAVVSANGMMLQVVKGLADPACFTFHTDDDRYLRHSGYRLRFDAPEDADLFRADATFCPKDGAEPGSITLRSFNYKDHVVHHRDAELWIDESDGSDAFDAASSFIVRETA